MKRLLVVTLLFGSLAGCQNPNMPSTSPEQVTSLKPTSTPNNNSKTTPPSSGNKPSASPTSTTTTAKLTQGVDSNQQPCKFSAYVTDKDPKGLNVRSGASSSQSIINKLPTNTGVVVDISACQGNWLQITKAETNEKIEFQGKGWVNASLLGTSTRGYGTQGVSVYASPSNQSQVMGRIPPDTSVKLVSGDGQWVLVEYQGLQGWLAPNDQCPNPFTTCP